MRNILLSLIVGTLFGAIGATAVLTLAQSPEWFNTPQGQYQRQRDIFNSEADLELLERPYPKAVQPWKPC